MSFETSLPRLLDVFTPADENEAAILAQIRQFLAESKNAYDRSNLTAHVVADAWIVNLARTHVVLIEHGANKRWMAPGGHCDGDPDVRAGAMREAMEEAGLTNLKPLLDGNVFDLNSGHVPLRHKSNGIIEPAHVHFDICFAFEAPDNAALQVSHESTGVKWVPVKDIATMNYYPDHMRRVEKTLNGKLS